MEITSLIWKKLANVRSRNLGKALLLLSEWKFHTLYFNNYGKRRYLFWCFTNILINCRVFRLTYFRSMSFVENETKQKIISTLYRKYLILIRRTDANHLINNLFESHFDRELSAPCVYVRDHRCFSRYQIWDFITCSAEFQKVSHQAYYAKQPHVGRHTLNRYSCGSRAYWLYSLHVACSLITVQLRAPRISKL